MRAGLRLDRGSAASDGFRRRFAAGAGKTHSRLVRSRIEPDCGGGLPDGCGGPGDGEAVRAKSCCHAVEERNADESRHIEGSQFPIHHVVPCDSSREPAAIAAGNQHRCAYSAYRRRARHYFSGRYALRTGTRSLHCDSALSALFLYFVRRIRNAQYPLPALSRRRTQLHRACRSAGTVCAALFQRMPEIV
ncbi:hypothetical protein SDC9_166605 [bioreactor metagenome]|uniref:Uncharacterized protein n=1 Tax=bioreactor metagenome TaxID=1076179 RepID=A0A645G042_9ZZZZ